MDNNLRTLWESGGYRATFGSAAVVPPPSQEFIRVYHLTSAEFAISNIALGRLKVARFTDLNDPFELISVNLRERRTRKIIRDFKDYYNQSTGLLCFSADWTNPVLWSHYATKHFGICLGFDVLRTNVTKVKYEDERILQDIGENGDPTQIGKSLQTLLISTKFKHWQYEEEYRMFVNLKNTIEESPLNFVEFDNKIILKEVILGPQCRLSLDAVRKLSKERYPESTIFKSRLAFKFFKVVPDERTVPKFKGEYSNKNTANTSHF